MSQVLHPLLAMVLVKPGNPKLGRNTVEYILHCYVLSGSWLAICLGSAPLACVADTVGALPTSSYLFTFLCPLAGHCLSGPVSLSLMAFFGS